MKTVAIITEYNPFHNGHKYQIDQIRKLFGKDTRIIAIMSGNFTQRGEVAILDKDARAKSAVLEGVNLVLELPFPFSIGSAEFFAGAGVEIANSLGIIDYLIFGSECGKTEDLITFAKNTLSDEYKSTLHALLDDKSNIEHGYAALCEMAYRKVFAVESDSIKLTPNNILAIEYIRALIRSGSNITPYTILRKGADFHASITDTAPLQSATGIREALTKNELSALDFLPKYSKELICEQIKLGKFPCDGNRLGTAVITHLRLNSQPVCDNLHDAGGGLYNRLISSANEANDLETLIRLTETKKYTTARICRVIWYSLFGVTSSDMLEKPLYTQILAMDTVGRTMLKEIRKRSNLTLLTKPSSIKSMSEKAQRQRMLGARADSIFELTKPVPSFGDFAMRFTPFVKD